MTSFASGRRRTFSTLFPAVVVALVFMAGGCASPAEKQKGKVDIALKDFGTSLDTLDARIEASVRAIDRLQSTQTYDFQRAYMDYMTEYFNVTADAASVKEQAEVMRDSGVDYFVTAKKEAATSDNAKAREELAKREADTKTAYNVLQSKLGELDSQYTVYRGQLNSIYKSLNGKVTRERIASAGPQLTAARNQASVLRTAIAATKGQANRLTAAAQ